MSAVDGPLTTQRTTTLARAMPNDFALWKAQQDSALERALHQRSPTGAVSTAAGVQKLTPLQKHVGFWDRNKDGLIYPWETFAGFYALGFNPLLALVSALAFHILHVGYPTHSSWIPNPLLPVEIANIHRAKHGSDTESYDTAGRFVREKFEQTFAAYSSVEGKEGLTFSDIRHMWVGNRNVGDVIGWSFQVFLWAFLWALAADAETGVLHKEDVLRQYDGTLYYELEIYRKNHRLPWFRGGTGLGWPKTSAAAKVRSAVGGKTIKQNGWSKGVKTQ
ncbi:Caleosin related protein-domain-containing protein [Geranomyces variabilis]|nr:Caleosin related protein-domain-containing protein [Geranomyces variabilis]KAJ3136025.1 hypothetical protein HDU90_003427 [Geranomyces variabilis]